VASPASHGSAAASSGRTPLRGCGNAAASAGQEARDVGGVASERGGVAAREAAERLERDRAGCESPSGRRSAADERERTEDAVARDDPAVGVLAEDVLAGRPAEQQRVEGAEQ